MGLKIVSRGKSDDFCRTGIPRSLAITGLLDPHPPPRHADHQATEMPVLPFPNMPASAGTSPPVSRRQNTSRGHGCRLRCLPAVVAVGSLSATAPRHPIPAEAAASPAPAPCYPFLVEICARRHRNAASTTRTFLFF
jgi:hypothetical protein